MAEQLTIEAVRRQYENVSSLTNEELYEKLVNEGVVSLEELNKLDAIGKKQQQTSKVKRSIRWLQQSLRQSGILKKSGVRGTWELAVSDTEIDDSLFVAPKDLAVIGYSTDLGMAIWGDSRQIISDLPIDSSVHLVLTSPPYPLQNPRRYDTKRTESDYITFILSVLEPITRQLAEGGSVVLNLSNDVFKKGSPSRSTYLERLTLAIEDELGLQLMDRITWSNPNKPPSPTLWACRRPTQLKSGYEPILFFSNNPLASKANNRNILLPNSERMTSLYRAGGENREVTYGDGAYSLSQNSYSKETLGTLQSNVLKISGNCKDTRLVNKIAPLLGLSRHGAMYPSALPELLIRWLTEEGQLIVDPFAGSNKTGLMAEKLNRMWISIERVADYIQLSRALFSAKGYL